jgi:hypothetical protein
MPMSTMSAFSAPITADTLALYTSAAVSAPASLKPCDSTATLVGKDFEQAFGALQKTQGLHGAPVVAPAAKKHGLKALFKRASKPTLAPAPTAAPTSGGKDFFAALGALQANYGTCGAPVVSGHDRKT